MGITRLLLGIVVGLMLPIVVIVIIKVGKTPEKEIGKARLAISTAREAQADIYADKLFEESKKLYDQAMLLWREENEKWIISRDYRESSTLAEESYLKASSACDEAIITSASFISSLNKNLVSTRQLIADYQDVFLKLPVTRAHREENSRGRLLFSEAELAYKEGHYSLCNSKLNESKSSLVASYNKANEMMEEYFRMWPQWDKWVRGAVETSLRDNTKTIVIDKFARMAYLYSEGKVLEEYRVDLGSNWIGDKREKGDKATPEGIYKITELKNKGRTSYYKALLLDYPNSDDRARFSLEKKLGQIMKNAEIGSLIEIHGEGGTGTDWTDGCIALKNSDMDKLYSKCKIGTPVTIVGSVKSLKEIINKDPE